MKRQANYKGTKVIGVTYKGNDRDFILESSLARIKDHINNGFFIISADRKEYSEEQKAEKQLELIKDFKNNKLGYIPLYGSWIENEGKEDEKEVSEVSFFVPKPKEYEVNKFLDLATNLLEKYQQEEVLYADDDKNIYRIKGSKGDPKSDVFELGKYLSVNDIGSFYSRLKKGSHRGIKFVFEGVIVPVGSLAQIVNEHNNGQLSVSGYSTKDESIKEWSN